jgi:hypothetical protein
LTMSRRSLGSGGSVPRGRRPIPSRGQGLEMPRHARALGGSHALFATFGRHLLTLYWTKCHLCD